jgi:hypothetical protein
MSCAPAMASTSPFSRRIRGRYQDNISNALSVNYERCPMLAKKPIYRVNSLLRKPGGAPAAPGISPWRDRLKLAAAKGLIAAHGLIRRKPEYPVWTPP